MIGWAMPVYNCEIIYKRQWMKVSTTGWAGMGRAGPGRAGPGRAGPGRAEQGGLVGAEKQARLQL